jgi:hypothetical protein
VLIPPASDRTSGPGTFRGRHYTRWVPEMHRLKKQGPVDDFERLVLALVDAVEAESQAGRGGVAPAYYRELAILYRKQGRRDDERRILERFAAQRHALGVWPKKLLARLERLKAAGGLKVRGQPG